MVCQRGGTVGDGETMTALARDHKVSVTKMRRVLVSEGRKIRGVGEAQRLRRRQWSAK
jgi:hypothetical protein